MIFKGSCQPKPFRDPLEKMGGYTEAHYGTAYRPTAVFPLQWQSGSMTYVIMTGDKNIPGGYISCVMLSEISAGPVTKQHPDLCIPH